MRGTALLLVLAATTLSGAATAAAAASPSSVCSRAVGIPSDRIASTRAALKRALPDPVWRGLESDRFLICGGFRTNDERLGAVAFRMPMPPVGRGIRIRTLYEGKTVAEARAVENEARHRPAAFLRSIGGNGASGTLITAVNRFGRFVVVTTLGKRTG